MTISDSLNRIVERIRASHKPAIPQPPLDQDPALSPHARTKLVRLAHSYRKGGKKALAKTFDELDPTPKP